MISFTRVPVLTLFPGGGITWFVLATPNVNVMRDTPVTVSRFTTREQGHQVGLVPLSDHTHLKVSTGQSIMVTSPLTQ
jgi:hypothetical protein